MSSVEVLDTSRHVVLKSTDMTMYIKTFAFRIEAEWKVIQMWLLSRDTQFLSSFKVEEKYLSLSVCQVLINVI